MKREVEGPDKTFLTKKESIAWLESQGVDADDDLFKDWTRRGYIIGIRKYSRQRVLYHWRGLVALLWRIELDDALSQKGGKVEETEDEVA